MPPQHICRFIARLISLGGVDTLLCGNSPAGGADLSLCDTPLFAYKHKLSCPAQSIPHKEKKRRGGGGYCICSDLLYWVGVECVFILPTVWGYE